MRCTILFTFFKQIYDFILLYDLSKFIILLLRLFEIDFWIQTT